MKIVIIKREKLYKFELSNENINTFWLKDLDENNNERELICVGRSENGWFLVSNEKCYLESSEGKIPQINLSLNVFYPIKIVEEKGKLTSALIYLYNENDVSFSSYKITADGQYSIGKGNDQSIIFDNQYLSDKEAMLIKNGDFYSIGSVNNDSNIFVNNNKVSLRNLEFGDKIFIYGLSIIIMKDYIVINNPGDKLKINSQNIVRCELPKYQADLLPTVEDDDATIYAENDYFSRQPRFVTSINEEVLNIDSPPGKVEPDNTPLMYTLGPMLTMSMSSIASMCSTLINFIGGNASFWKILPTLLITIAMLCSMILWPSLMRKYNKNKMLKKEEERQYKYREYLEKKKNKIQNIKNNQIQILNETYVDPNDLTNVIINRKRNLWERQIESDDFLNVRIGTGTVPLKIKLNYSVEDFTMVEDDLKDALNSITESSKDIASSPVTISLTERNKLVLIGENYYRESMLKSILLQLATYHSYNDLKLVFLLSDDSNDMWSSFKLLPHVWNDGKDVRFYANNYDDVSKLSFYLEQVFTARKYSDDGDGKTENNITYRDVRPYYLIIIDNIKKYKNIEIITKILEEKMNIGFGIIILNDGISNLPNECSDFITVSKDSSAVIKNDLNKNNQQTFVMDNVDNINLALLCEKLSNIPIKQTNVLSEFKSSIGFLEMYKVGNIEQLNILDRWQKNNPINSLSVPIGVHTDGEIFNLDLHEKFHGPHGLIAGMTGSGKSEFIITYILSMCLNFSPVEVSFVLIDYKGGGLTGAFENDITGLKLPHLAGTITNLDTAEIKRSLSSIQSELKRRQELFNKVKHKLNESTLDIYKYQKLYRDNVIDIPISHLFIVCDEFAELKSEQSEFMNELISAARIGRSLGVHLILATQKPSGIVDDQIWSNSKFKVCLKVQERADSVDVIKRPDAIHLKKAGRFYLQVGYNDYFAMGQAAFAGTKYIPKDKITKVVDRNLSFINNIGDTVRSVETVQRNEVVSNGEELQNVLKHISAVAKSKNLFAEKLWLEKIPAEIFVTDLIKKYSFLPKKFDLTAILGEYDDPHNQRQDLLTLNLNENANTIIYGSTGKEIMLSTIIYSLIIHHTTDELNIYILDFGAEMFGIYSAAPQVADVVYINQDEKLLNLFNYLNKELEKRKKLFADYNGSYNLYVKTSGKTLPRLIIIINNYEALSENYEEFIDVISSLSREGDKYGISFIISASGANSVRSKTSQNFSNLFCLQFNDNNDYMSILGPTHGMIPSSIEGRGLVKIDNQIYEFQTAYPYKWDKINAYIKEICNRLNQKLTLKASKIPVLPNLVRLTDIDREITDLTSVPIGIEKDTLMVSTYNFSKQPISLISSVDIQTLNNFIPSLYEVFENIKNVDVHIIDSNDNIICSNNNKNYYNSNYEVIINKIKSIIENPDNMSHVFIIYGVESFINYFDFEMQRQIKELFVQLKNYKNIRIIFADSISKIKIYEYEDFYKNCVQPSDAIWLGYGITDQYTIKCMTYNKQTRSQLEHNFGFNVKGGTAKLVKVLDFYSEDEVN